MIVADFGGDFDGSRGHLERNPITAFDAKVDSFESRVVADDDPIVLRVQIDDVEGTRGREAEALALADGIELDAVVMTEHTPLHINDFAAVFFHELRLL